MTRENEFGLAPRPWATYTLIAANTMAFFAAQASMGGLQSINEHLLELGALQPVLVWKGEIWRLASAIFLHASFFHYALNTYVLLQIGRLFEPVIGSTRLLFLFLLTGSAGFALSILANAELTLGSSGAIFGLIGGLMGALMNLPKWRTEPKLLRTLVFFVVLNLAFGGAANYLLPGIGRIDNASHIGGLAFGFIFGFAFVTETSNFQAASKEFKASRQRFAAGFLVIGLLGFFTLFSASIRPVFLERFHETMAFDALVSHDYQNAEEHTKWLKESPRGIFAAQVMLSRLAANRNEPDQAYDIAREALKKWPEDIHRFWKTAVFEKKPTMDYQSSLFADELGNSILCKAVIDFGARETEILNDCAWLFLMSRQEKARDPQKALDLALRAVKSDKDLQATVLHTLAEAYLQNGMLVEAIHTIDRGMLIGDRISRSELLEQKRRAEARLEKSSVQRKI